MACRCCVPTGQTLCYGTSRAAALWCDSTVRWVDVTTGATLTQAQRDTLVECAGGVTIPPPLQVAVPDVVGQTQASAEAEITAAGLTSSDTDVCSDVVAAGNVISQAPAAGTMVNTGTNVAITTSTGPCPVAVEVIAPLDYQVAPTATQRAAFDAARDFWNSVLTELLDPVDFEGDPAYRQIHINVDLSPIDGPGQIAGQASPTMLRPGSLLTLEGDMTFDSDDLDNIEAAGFLEEVARHEMAHVIGVGTLWSLKGLEVGANTANWGFTGPLALAEYNALAGRPAGNLDRVPVEHNTGNAGTDGGHWNENNDHTSGENCMTNELMSGNASGSLGVSRVTIASIEDLGYPGVDYSPADPWVCGNA